MCLGRGSLNPPCQVQVELAVYLLPVFTSALSREMWVLLLRLPSGLILPWEDGPSAPFAVSPFPTTHGVSCFPLIHFSE